jgi:hypothetical protein
MAEPVAAVEAVKVDSRNFAEDRVPAPVYGFSSNK